MATTVKICFKENDAGDLPPVPPPPPPEIFPEISSKLQDLGEDLVRHIVVATLSPPTFPDEADVIEPIFPPQNSGGAFFLNLFTTDRVTLRMRRLVTKALQDKSLSFTAMMNVLPQIPNTLEEFRDCFSIVVDQMISLTHQPPHPLPPIGGLQRNEMNITWGKVVTAYAFGLRVMKASVDQPMEEGPGAVRHLDASTWGRALGDIINSKMGEWIASHGGWNGFYEYFMDGQVIEESIAKNLLLVFGISLITVGVLAVYKLTQK